MGEALRHECGIALIRLKKPLQYYAQNYGTTLYGFQKLFLLMEKQHNRGQDGAGIGAVKLDMPKGQPYMFRERALTGSNSLGQLFKKLLKRYDKLVRNGDVVPEFAATVKEHFAFGAEVLMGHLRYGTSGAFDESACHPYVRRSNWPTRNLMVLGNFTMTNTDELNERLIERGQHPIYETDTQTILEEIGYHLDEENQRLYHEARDDGVPGADIPELISKRLDLPGIIRQSASGWDGGYVIAGMLGNGDAFILRDPNGIRPAHYIETEEFFAFASERAPLVTVFGVPVEQVREVPPGEVLTVRHDTTFGRARFCDPQPRASCSFERIYFSRGNDPSIYRERKALGAALAPQILEAIEYDLENTVFSFVPNTAETSSYGLLEELRNGRRAQVKAAILRASEEGALNEELLDDLILRGWPRSEKVAHKDIKLRTFISQESGRSKLVSHVYDVTYGVVKPTDNLVVLDDSIVRGTTLRESIIKILGQIGPKRIIIASTAPQIRYPDCYGIDMSELGKFVAFQATVALLRERGKEELLREVYADCARELEKPKTEMINHVKRLYHPFTDEEISAKVAEMLLPRENGWKGDLKIIYQRVKALHRAIPEHSGDWYFTGNFPTPGGYAVVNQAYVNYYENRSGRSYDRMAARIS